MASIENLLKGDGHASQMLRGGAGGVFVRVTSLALEFILVGVLARTLGSTDYGIYVYAFSLMRLCAIPAQVGLPTLIVREVAAYQERKQWPLIRGLIFWSTQAVLIMSIVMAFAISLTAWFIFKNGTEDHLSVYLWAAVLLPFIALGNIRGATLRGLHHVVLGQLPESVFRPFIFVTFLAAICLSALQLTPSSAMALHVGAAFIAFVLGTIMLIKRLPQGVRTSLPEYEGRRWISSALPLSLIMGMVTFNNQISLIVLGFFRPASDVGVFSVAGQMALVSTVPLTIINLAVAPHISKLFVQGDMKRLQTIATVSARVLLPAVFSIFILFFLFGEFILIRVFGPNFLIGYPALIILCVGYCFSSLAGASMIFLNMTKNEKGVAWAFAIAVLVNLIINFLLVPKYGLVGSAISMAISMTMLNIVLYASVKTRLKLNPLAFGRTD